MIKHKFLIVFLLITAIAKSQELFVLTEPASNMPAKTLGIRSMNSWMKETSGGTNYHMMPEMMWGVNNKLMLHALAFISNRNKGLVTEGAGIYAKYRFLSKDQVHSHFRMALFGRIGFNNSDIHQHEIETMGHNSGYELGIVATQLLHKVAFSGAVSFEQATNNGSKNKFPTEQDDKAINYSFSVGKLLLPKEYKAYKQTNFNVMLEFLGQRLISGASYIDIAPSIQFIINSQARIDLAWRKELYSNMLRTAPNGVILKLEYNLFSVFK
jgi:hypothetical protein